MAEDSSLSRLVKGGIRDMVSAEDLLMESFRDIVKDEVKRKVRDQLDRDPELKREMQEAIGMFFEAKVHEAYASLKLAKAGAKLGIGMLPDHMREELRRELMETMERELGKVLAKSI